MLCNDVVNKIIVRELGEVLLLLTYIVDGPKELAMAQEVI